MKMLSFSALLVAGSLAFVATASSQAPSSPAQTPAPAADVPHQAPAQGEGTNAGNPGYPIQGGGTYQGPPGKGSVVDDDHRYNRT